MRMPNLPGILFMSVLLILALAMPGAAASVMEISLLPCEPSEWESVDAAYGSIVSKGTVMSSDGALFFGNTCGLWPAMKCSFEGIVFNHETDMIIYDFTPRIKTNVIIHFLDGEGESRFVYINPAVAGVLLDSVSGEIKPSAIRLKGEISLGSLKTGHYSGGEYSGETVSSYADSRGNIIITGVQIDIIGSGGKTVDFRTLAAQVEDKTAETTGSTGSTAGAVGVKTKTHAGAGGIKTKTQTDTGKSESLSARQTQNTGTFKPTVKKADEQVAVQTRSLSQSDTGKAETATSIEAATTSVKTVITTAAASSGSTEFRGFKEKKLLVPAGGTALLVISLIYFKKQGLGAGGN